MKHVSILFLVLFVGCASAHKKEGDKTGKGDAAAKVVSEKSNVVKDKKAKAAAAATTTTAAKAAGAVTCKSGGDERVLEVVAEGGGCKTMYTKGGQANSVATSGNGTQHCQDVSDKILAKLQAAGFNCQ
jgi:hypothetical protein